MNRILIVLILILAIPVGVSSQNLIAVQNNNNPTFYTSLDSAIIYAQNGDTIYISGGTFTLTVPIEKRLHIVGVGYLTDSTAATGPTIIIGTLKLINSAEGGSITGGYFTGSILCGTNSSNSTLNGYEISRCYFTNLNGITFNYTNSSTNIKLHENIFGGANVSLAGKGAQFICCNNIFRGTISNLLGSNSIFLNNIFLMQNPGTYFNIGRLITFSNNIFCCPMPYYSFQISTFRNNVNPTSANITTGIDADTNSYQNNIYIVTDSIFINVPGNPTTCSRNYSHSYNFQLRPNSAAKNAGTDGTDIGIFGGLYPWKEGGLPFNSHIQIKTIVATTDTNGNLDVNIKVAAQER